MARGTPLSTLLSQLLVAFTIELDNEFERRFERAGGGARVTSLVMWSNLLRFVGDGIAVGDLPEAVGLQKSRVFSAVGGVERWRYVYVTPRSRGGQPREKREGYGSARGLRRDWFVRFTPAGRRAAAIWPELFGELETRWRERFGTTEIRELEGALREIRKRVDLELPEYLPIVTASNGMLLDLPSLESRRGSADPALVPLLAYVLLAFTVDFEDDSDLSLPLSENVLRVLDERGVRVRERELPQLAGISKEAVAMALSFLAKTEYVVVDGTSAATKALRLTSAGRKLQADRRRFHDRIETQWSARFGTEVMRRLRVSLERILAHPELPSGLRPPLGGWRGIGRYASQTEARLADPRSALPHYPMVLHRGGWPDGS